jgi:chorismate mutase
MYVEESTGKVRTRTNNAGGIAGGISNGEDIIVRIAVKPTSSIRKEQETVTVDRKPATISVQGRHDPCICPRVVPVAESMVALVIFDHLTRLQLLRKSTKLRDLRDTIDQIDHNIVLLLFERLAVVRQIGSVKKHRGTKIGDRKREAEVLRKQLAVARDLELDEEFTRDLFKAIFQLSRATQRAAKGKAQR